jgi:phage-related tail fiber protein
MKRIKTERSSSKAISQENSTYTGPLSTQTQASLAKKKKKTHLATKFKISNGRSKEMKYEQDFAFDFPKMITNANSSSGKVSLTASITNKVQGKTAR